MSRLTFLIGSKSYLLVSNFACFNQIFSNFVDVFSATKSNLMICTKSNLMIYNLSMFERIIIVVTVNYDVIGFYETGSLEKSGRTVFEIVSPTNDFETIKMGLP